MMMMIALRGCKFRPSVRPFHRTASPGVATLGAMAMAVCLFAAATFGLLSGSADHYGKEQYDTIIYAMLHNNFFSRSQDRNLQVANKATKPCTRATAFASTTAASHQPHAHAQHTRKYPRDSRTHHAGHLRACHATFGVPC